MAEKPGARSPTSSTSRPSVSALRRPGKALRRFTSLDMSTASTASGNPPTTPSHGPISEPTRTESLIRYRQYPAIPTFLTRSMSALATAAATPILLRAPEQAPLPGAREPAPLPGAPEQAPLPGAREPAPLPGAREPAPLPGAAEPAPLPGAPEQVPPSPGLASHPPPAT